MPCMADRLNQMNNSDPKQTMPDGRLARMMETVEFAKDDPVGMKAVLEITPKADLAKMKQLHPPLDPHHHQMIKQQAEALRYDPEKQAEFLSQTPLAYHLHGKD